MSLSSTVCRWDSSSLWQTDVGGRVLHGAGGGHSKDLSKQMLPGGRCHFSAGGALTWAVAGRGLGGSHGPWGHLLSRTLGEKGTSGVPEGSVFSASWQPVWLSLPPQRKPRCEPFGSTPQPHTATLGPWLETRLPRASSSGRWLPYLKLISRGHSGPVRLPNITLCLVPTPPLLDS